MPADDRNLLEVLKRELKFLEAGGYRNASDVQWRTKFIFEDSPTCLNFQRTTDPRPCDDCVMATSFLLIASAKDSLAGTFRSMTQDSQSIRTIAWEPSRRPKQQ